MFALTDKIDFGKYKGKTVAEVLKTDHGYIGWLRTEKVKQGMDLLTPEADKVLESMTKMKNLSPRADQSGVKPGEKSMTKLEKDFKRKAEKEAREADANRTREEVYGSEWGGW